MALLGCPSTRYEAGRLVAQLDRQGRSVLTFGYAGENLVRITDRAGREVSVTYAGDQIATVTDAQGRTTRFGYTGNRLTSVTEASGLVTTFTYDVYGYLRTLSDNAGRSRVYDYNYDIAKRQFYAMTRTSGGRTEEYWFSSDLELVRRDVDGRTVLAVSQDGRSHTLTDASGLKTIKEYDEWDNLIRTVHPDGSEEKRTYDRVFHQVLTKTDTLGVVTAYSYDELGNVLSLTEALGTHLERNSTFAYDEAGQVVNATRGPGATTMEYDQWGNLVRLVDAAGGVTAFTHDALGNVLTRRDGAGQVWTSKYNNAGQLVQAVDPSGNATSYEYDPSGNRVRTVDPAGHLTILGYDLAGRMVNATDALGGVTRFQYDSEDRLTGREDAAGLAQSYGYTSTGELAETVDAAGTTRMIYAAQGVGCTSCSGGSGDKPVRIEYPTFTRTLSYDQRGRKVRETDTSTTETRGQDFVYDKAGRLVETQQWAHDPDLVQSSTKYEYDLLGRMTCTTDASGGQTRYVYDVWDNLKTLTDPKDQSTHFAHDALGRVTVETRPLGGQTTYAYTLAGQLQNRIDARGVRTEYKYDALGRVSTVSSYAPGQTELGRVVSLSYDQLGRLTSYTDGQTSGLLAYDALGRKTAETVNYGPFSRTNTYTWAANGQLSGFTGPDGQAQTFAYDTAGRLTAIGLGSHMAPVDAYTWTAPGSMTLPGGVKRTYGHDGFLRLIAQNATDPAAGAIVNHAYQYNDRGNMARKATEHGDYVYAYDILDRLITSQNPGLSDESFTYDKVGNRLSAGDTIGPWSYNANNELLSVDAVTYRYDDHGNLIEKTQPGKTQTFAYDLDNRLSEVKENSAALATYGYDPFGRRIWKEVHGSRTYYHYSDQGLVAELDATGTLLKSYGYKPDSPWGTDPLYVRQGGKNHWYLTDHLGTPQQVAAENGAIVWQAQYAVFGKAEVDAGSTLVNNLRFPGQYYDAETGLHYNWNRYYDPEAGRYTQADPIGFEGGDVNLYVYAGMNSVMNYDFEGLSGCRPHVPPSTKNSICPPSQMMEKCLEKIFNKPVNDIVVYIDPEFIKWHFPDGSIAATTRKNSIYINDTCDGFWNDPEWVLHEYYHVVQQWGIDGMSIPGYLLFYKQKEDDAVKFSLKHVGEFKKCLNLCP